MDPISAPAAIPEPATAAPPTISGANGSSQTPLPTAAVEKALASPPADGVLDLDAMVASYRDGKWYDLPIGGRFKVRAAPLSTMFYQVDLETAYRVANNMEPTAKIPASDQLAIGLKVARDRRITDFDRFRMAGAPLPNRTPAGALHMDNLDLLLALAPVAAALMEVLRKANTDAIAEQQAEQGNSPKPSPTN